MTRIGFAVPHSRKLKWETMGRVLQRPCPTSCPHQVSKMRKIQRGKEKLINKFTCSRKGVFFENYIITIAKPFWRKTRQNRNSKMRRQLNQNRLTFIKIRSNIDATIDWQVDAKLAIQQSPSKSRALKRQRVTKVTSIIQWREVSGLEGSPGPIENRTLWP